MRLQALKDKYDNAACIKLSAQTNIKYVTWSLQQNGASEASGSGEQPNEEDVTVKDAAPHGLKEVLEDVEMQDTVLTSSIPDVKQAPPVV